VVVLRKKIHPWGDAAVQRRRLSQLKRKETKRKQKASSKKTECDVRPAVNKVTEKQFQKLQFG
jgi:hypothetical protein